MTGKRATWNDNTSKRLVDICIDEKENGSSKFDWGKIAKNLSVQTSMNFGTKQVTNHYNDLKDKYKAWVELRQIMSGIGFHPITGAVSPHETHLERWQAFEEKHRKHANMLAKKGLPNAEDLERLFAGRTATGERGFSTAMARSKVVNDLFGEGEGAGEEDGERGVDSEDELDQNVNSHSDVSGEKNSSSIGPPSISRKRKVSEVVENKMPQANLDKVLDFLYKTTPTTTTNVNKTEMVSFALREMEVSKERGDKYFVVAMRYLSEGNNGDIFLALENVNQKWIFLDEGMDPKDTCYIPRHSDEWMME
ncbi:hypothetical protein OROMI_002175 [Orobanche minor]